ncbi:hypothetical protein C1646_672516 [Rhizophagus diaphanus]|nr:hypothetical protein C1646_672516 [Rhizophagus diaphanus] [Rhizophagus sp. MUCL 43196]
MSLSLETSVSLELSGPRETYGKCSLCKQQRIATMWCEKCDIMNLKECFPNWTSGNSILDEFIRFTKLNAKESMDYLEWIDFNQFVLIKDINDKGAFSSIYSAVWTEGPRWNLDEETEIWTRTGPIKVILKRLDNSHNLSQEFINQHQNSHDETLNAKDNIDQKKSRVLFIF